ncbi:Zinc uptake regulation protein [Saliniradius amylolyticus]|uniref:Ferric uptake regulation protein n=1 Tax=Saliniradius amylolyticus TaxID=2183582 RepID=A0A2S2E4D6_9ALTE|nr:transcriptional repressor [Saliniradius amylolyticus]AWL12504.1 Zinc uptake regulation protein [Saliniradius amylolyticus]
MEHNALLSHARRFCEGKGARFTQLREKVYGLLLQRQGATGAYELLDELRQTESSAKPATVYRVLDFLLELGLVHRLESNNSYIACHHFDCNHPVQFLICDQCGEVKEIQSEGLKETLDKQANQYGFRVVKQTIEAHGTCARCQH